MEYVIYHKSQAGNPELHTDGNWYYQPDGYDSGDVFSRGYATREAAEEACWLWATTEDEDEPTIRYDPDINADEIRRAIRNGGGWLVDNELFGTCAMLMSGGDFRKLWQCCGKRAETGMSLPAYTEYVKSNAQFIYPEDLA